MELKILDYRISGLTYGSELAAGADLRACTLDPVGSRKAFTEAVNLYPGHKVKIGCGFALHLGVNTCALILPRSGLGTAGIRLSNVIGLIDADYQGEVIVAIENQSNDVFILEPLARIAQLVITPFLRPHFEIVDEFTVATKRGDGGFGSTGTA